MSDKSLFVAEQVTGPPVSSNSFLHGCVFGSSCKVVTPLVLLKNATSILCTWWLLLDLSFPDNQDPVQEIGPHGHL